MKKVSLIAFVLAFSASIFGVGTYVLADASSTLTTLMDTIINTSVGFATTVITNYWPYVLVFGIISALIALFVRFTHLGTGRGK